MKKQFCFLIGLIFLAGVVNAQAIKDVQVHFKTKGTSKDPDSDLEVIYKTASGDIIASKTDKVNAFQPYSDNSESLDVNPHKIDASKINGSMIAVTYLPSTKGADKLSFDLDLYITLTDDSKKIYSFRDITLAKDKKNWVEKSINF